jgi:hypothetical protein
MYKRSSKMVTSPATSLLRKSLASLQCFNAIKGEGSILQIGTLYVHTNAAASAPTRADMGSNIILISTTETDNKTTIK